MVKHRRRKIGGIIFYLANEFGSIGQARASVGYWRRREFRARIVKVHHKNTGWTYEVWVSITKRRR